MNRNEFRARVTAATLIFTTEVVSKIALSFTPRNDFYFLVCAVFGVLLLAALSCLSDLPVVRDLKTINYIQLVTQLLGWCLYSVSVKPTLYNAAITTLMIAQAIRLLWWKENVDRHSARDWGRILVDRFRASRMGNSPRGKR